jgi:hypothetical protein
MKEKHGMETASVTTFFRKFTSHIQFKKGKWCDLSKKRTSKTTQPKKINTRENFFFRGSFFIHCSKYKIKEIKTHIGEKN